MTSATEEIIPRSVRESSERPTMFARLPAVYQDPQRFRPAQLVETGPEGTLRASRWQDMLERGAQGEITRAVQQALDLARHDPGPADGEFGPRTEDAVRAFQRQRGLTIDGIVGPETADELTSSFLRRFLDGFQDVFDPILGTLDNLSAYVDVDTAPPPFLRWLAWIVGSTRSVVGDTGTDRVLVARALELHRRGATAQGIAELVAAHLRLAPGQVAVRDGGETAWDPDPGSVLTGERSRVVTIELPPDAADPAHVRYLAAQIVTGTLPIGFTVEVVFRT